MPRGRSQPAQDALEEAAVGAHARRHSPEHHRAGPQVPARGQSVRLLAHSGQSDLLSSSRSVLIFPVVP
eukprot:2181125-Rhodomonas_salina.2